MSLLAMTAIVIHIQNVGRSLQECFAMKSGVYVATYTSPLLQAHEHSRHDLNTGGTDNILRDGDIGEAIRISGIDE